MARRSLGVVLIVALLGWTVNWPIFGCKSQYSRAAVVVQAGASPAYQPEPSPTCHNCCPQVNSKSPSTAQPSFHKCLLYLSVHPGCCSVSKETESGLPPKAVAGYAAARFTLASLPSFEPILPGQAQSSTMTFAHSPGIQSSSFTVLRL